MCKDIRTFVSAFKVFMFLGVLFYRKKMYEKTSFSLNTSPEIIFLLLILGNVTKLCTIALLFGRSSHLFCFLSRNTIKNFLSYHNKTLFGRHNTSLNAPTNECLVDTSHVMLWHKCLSLFCLSHSYKYNKFH